MTPPCESCGTVEAVTYRVDGWRCQPCRSDWFDQTDDCPPFGIDRLSPEAIAEADRLLAKAGLT